MLQKKKKYIFQLDQQKKHSTEFSLVSQGNALSFATSFFFFGENGRKIDSHQQRTEILFSVNSDSVMGEREYEQQEKKERVNNEDTAHRAEFFIFRSLEICQIRGLYLKNR